MSVIPFRTSSIRSSSMTTVGRGLTRREDETHAHHIGNTRARSPTLRRSTLRSWRFMVGHDASPQADRRLLHSGAVKPANIRCSAKLDSVRVNWSNWVNHFDLDCCQPRARPFFLPNKINKMNRNWNDETKQLIPSRRAPFSQALRARHCLRLFHRKHDTKHACNHLNCTRVGRFLFLFFSAQGARSRRRDASPGRPPLQGARVCPCACLPLLALPICPSLGGLFACDEAKKALVSCSPQLKDIWLTSLSAP